MTNLKRIRWGVRAVLVLGVAASVVANILHARDNPISQAIAAWPPLALLLTVELISRIPVHSRGLAAARVIATALIAGIAAWVSYWHMAGVAARYGETGAAPYLIPVSVDGLIVVASICLVELGGRIREEVQAARPVDEGHADPRTPARVDGMHSVHTPALPGGEGALPSATDDGKGAHTMDTLAAADVFPGTGKKVAPAQAEGGFRRSPETSSMLAAPRRVAPRSLTAAKRVADAHGKDPAATHERIAKAAKVSVSTVKKYRPPNGSPSTPPPAQTRINGNVPAFVGAGHNEEGGA